MKYRIVRYRSGRYGVQHRSLFRWYDERDALEHRVSWGSYERAADDLLNYLQHTHAWKVSYVFSPQDLANHSLRKLQSTLEADLCKNAQDISQGLALEKAKRLEKRS